MQLVMHLQEKALHLVTKLDGLGVETGGQDIPELEGLEVETGGQGMPELEGLEVETGGQGLAVGNER